MEYYLDETFKPKTEIGKKLKQMVENGDHCDGNIYWLIEKVERLAFNTDELNALCFVLTDYIETVGHAAITVEGGNRIDLNELRTKIAYSK